jgi:hypothetical protein
MKANLNKDLGFTLKYLLDNDIILQFKEFHKDRWFRALNLVGREADLGPRTRR